ncbi:MAG: SDR family oxidoreductase [archaeon]
MITGASSGIGLAAAELFSKRGWIVYAGFRKTKVRVPGCRMVYLDVCDFSSIGKVVSRISQEQGQLDCLVNNAGYGLFGALEDVPPRAVEEQFRTNVLGLVEATRYALPFLRKSKGIVVNVSSVAGKIGFPFGSIYAGTKFAVEGISDSLRSELAPFKVKVAIVEPGPIRTNFSKYASGISRGALGRKGSPYGDYYLKREKIMERFEKYGLAPEEIARAIFSAATARNPKARYVVAGPTGILLFLKAFLPEKLLDWLVRKGFGLS